MEKSEKPSEQIADEEVIAHINKHLEEWERFRFYFVPIECDVDRLGMPWPMKWKSKEELLEMYPE